MTEKNNQVTMTAAQMQARIAELEAQVAAKNNQPILFKIGEDKGAIGIYGLSSKGFPISLYFDQLERFFVATTGQPLPADSPLGKFVATNDKYLSRKAEQGTDADKGRKTLRLAESHGVVAHPSTKNKSAA